MMKAILIGLILCISSCSLLNSDNSFELTPDQLNGTWERISFDEEFEINKNTDQVEEPLTQKLTYTFEDDSYNTCEITHSERPSNNYYECFWFLHGEQYPDLYLTIEYKVRNNPTNEIFRFLYQVIDNTDDSITLRTIRQTF